MENRSVRTLLLILLILYVVSPIDAIPGPLDDIVLAAIGISMLKE